jgi:hypothetical protein
MVTYQNYTKMHDQKNKKKKILRSETKENWKCVWHVMQSKKSRYLL